MKHFIIAILLASGICGHIIAQSSLLKNIVFIKNVENGVGLVIGQENEITYIITAYHVVKDAMDDTLSAEEKEITVYSYDKAIQWKGTILPGRVDVDRDIVCLTIRSGSYKFYEIPVSWEENATKDTPLFIIGKMKEKEILTDIRRISFSKNKNEMKFIVDDIHYEIRSGCSGSPVFSSDERFKGMVLAIDKTEVICLKLSSIKAFIFDESINHNLLLEKAIPNLNIGLIAYYPFNGNANDESGNGNPSGIVNGAILSADRFGHQSKAYSFDGSSSSIKINPFFNCGASQYSISVWFNSKNVNQSRQNILNTDPHIGMAFSLNHSQIPGYLVFWLSNSGLDWELPKISSGKNDFQDNTWYHLVLIKNNGMYTMYINGKLASSAYNSSFSNFTLNRGFYVGRSTPIHTEFFNGAIDDIRFYNRALSENEIMQLYQLKE